MNSNVVLGTMEVRMYWKYLKYIIRHKWFVFVECCQISKDPKYKIKLFFLGIVHDWSKLRLSEFIPYARYFYGNYPEHKNMVWQTTKYPHLYKQDIDRAFDKAWLYHIHRNKHHWQHWLLQEDDGPQKNIPVPIKYLLEMVADWKGAGRAINGKDDTDKWYEKNKHIINLNCINKKFVEKKIAT